MIKPFKVRLRATLIKGWVVRLLRYRLRPCP